MSIQIESIRTDDQATVGSTANLSVAVSQEVFVAIIRERNPNETLDSYLKNIMFDDFSGDVEKLAKHCQMDAKKALVLLQNKMNLTPKSQRRFQLYKELFIAKKENEESTALLNSVYQMIQKIIPVTQDLINNKTQYATTIGSLTNGYSVMADSIKTRDEIISSLRERVTTLEESMIESNQSIISMIKKMSQSSIRSQAVAALLPVVVLSSGYIKDMAVAGWNNLTNIFTNTTLSGGW